MIVRRALSIGRSRSGCPLTPGLLCLLQLCGGAALASPPGPDPAPLEPAAPAPQPETPDSTPPLQIRFDAPAPGHVVFGPTHAEVSVLPSDVRIERVEFFLDGARRAEDREAPYALEWDAGYDFLPHRLEAVAYAASGETARALLETARVALYERVSVEAEPLDLVEIAFVVDDHEGRPVRGLGKSDFRLRVDGRDTPLETVAEERRRRERPLSVAFLLDVSRSMRDLERERFLLAAQALLDRLRPSDEMMIVSFSDDYQIRSDFTKDPKALRAALESIPRPDWGTDLYAALEEALDRLSERPGRRVVILYSDGQATVGKSSLTATPYSLDVLDQTRRQPIPLYWIVPHFQDATIVQRTPALRSLALGSGGRWILEREGIEKALVEVGEDLGSQYFASFYVDKNEHRRPYYQIDLEPRGTGLKVQAPQVVAGSGSLVRRLEEMLASNKAEERLAAAVQLPRYGYAKAYFPLVQRYRREKDAGVRDAVLAALLAVMRDEWNDTGERAEVARDAQRRRLERQIRNLEDPRALALLEMLR